MRRVLWLWVLLAVLATVSVQATPILAVPTSLVIYSTGSDGTSLLGAGSTDPNYQYAYYAANTPWATLVQIPGVYPDPSTAYVVNANGFPYHLGGGTPGWLSDYGVQNLAKWIAPQADYNPPTPQSVYPTDTEGWYVWMTRFYVPDNYILDTIVLSGAASSDNCTFDVLINGTGTGMEMTAGTCLSQAHPFQFGGLQPQIAPMMMLGAASPSWTVAQGLYTNTASFIHGWNTLQFVVYNNTGSTANPTGLAAWLQLEGEAVPEASTIALAALGLGALALFRKNRK